MIWHQRKAGILAGWDWGHGCLIKRHQDGTWGEAHRPGLQTKGSAALWAHPHSRSTVVVQSLYSRCRFAGTVAAPPPCNASRPLARHMCVARALAWWFLVCQLPCALLSPPTGAPVFLKLRGGSLGLTVGLQTMQSISVLQVGLRRGGRQQCSSSAAAAVAVQQQ